MDTMQALQSRTSCRSYAGQAVEVEKIEKIVEAGNHAPNAGAFRITVIQDAEYLRQIDTAALDAMKNSGNDFLMERASLPGYKPLYGAPVLVLLSARPGGYSQANVACSATVMTIAATELGLGSCYVVTPTLALDGRNALSQKLGLSEDETPLCGVLLGYAGDGAPPAPRKAPAQINFV